MTPERRLKRRYLALLAVLGLVGAACSDDGGTEADVDPDPPEDTADDDGGSDDSEEVTTSSTEPDDSGETEDQGDAGAEENFASGRGVTADSIKVGVTVPDFEALQAAGLPNYQGDNRIAYQVFFDLINQAGGIHGRTIEPVYVDFDLLDPANQDAVCVELTQDQEVFIVLYGLLAQNNLCLTALNETMVMTHAYQTTEGIERSGDTVWLQLEPSDDEKARILGSVVAEAGYLDEATIGILAGEATGGLVAGEALQDVLADNGYDSKIYLAPNTGSDPTAFDQEMQTIAQRALADGIDFLFNLGGGGTMTEDLDAFGFHPDRTAYIVLNTATEATSNPALLDGALTVAGIGADAVWADPEFRSACVDPIIAAHPEIASEFDYLPDSDQQLAGERTWLTPTRNACNHTMLLKEVGEIVGADLNNETFRAALDELGPIDLHGYGIANFTSDGKWDGLDEFYLQEYDSATETLEVIGDPIIVDR